jgi:hypothetical protein
MQQPYYSQGPQGWGQVPQGYVPRRKGDDLQAPFWTLMALGTVSALLLVLGLSNLITATMPWAHTGLKVQVTGVFPYDPRVHTVTDGAGTSFKRGQEFAAKVDWSSLPRNLEVGGVWYDSQDREVSALAPAPAGQLAAQQAVVPMTDSQALPGSYRVLVMHYVDGKPIEILGRKSARVVL